MVFAKQTDLFEAVRTCIQSCREENTDSSADDSIVAYCAFTRNDVEHLRGCAGKRNNVEGIGIG